MGGGRGGWVMGIEEGTFWDEHWVLYGNQFDNKFRILKKKWLKTQEQERGGETLAVSPEAILHLFRLATFERIAPAECIPSE